MWELILPLLGFFIAVIAAMTGIGGGVFFVPLLTLGYGFSPDHAIGTSLLIMVFGGIGASIGYARQKRVYFKVGLLFALITAPGAIVGAYLTSFLPGTILSIIFSVFLIIIAIRIISVNKLVRKRKNSDKELTVKCERDCFADRSHLITGFVLCFFVGLASGLLGIGGGILLVPILLFVVFVPIHVAVATSMFVMVLTSVFGVFQHHALGNIDFTFALLLAIGAFIGAQVGAWLSKKVSGDRLQLILGATLILISIQMIIKFI